MKYSIKKGNHWPGLIGWLNSKWIKFSKKPFVVRRSVVFYPDCKYELRLAEDMSDVNKLFGVAFGHLHKDSARFGWNYDTESGKFILYAYCYVNGQRQFDYIGEVGLMEQSPLICSISIEKDAYYFNVWSGGKWITKDFMVRKMHDKTISFGLGCWFGGNNPAPKDMTIKIEKL